MRRKPLTIHDLCSATGYSRHALRGLLDLIPRYAETESQARVAAEYDPHDFIVIAVCCHLESHYCIKRQAVVRVVEEIARAMRGPKEPAPNPKLVVRCAEGTAQYKEAIDSIEDGLVVSLKPIYDRVTAHLVGPIQMMQGELPIAMALSGRAPVKRAKRRTQSLKSKTPRRGIAK